MASTREIDGLKADGYAAKVKDQPAETLQLIAETAEVVKNRVVTGRVDIHTITDTIPEHVKQTVGSQTVEVTRVAIDRQVDTVPAIRTEGDVTVIPVLEEILVVEKRLVLKEEIRIRRISRSEEVETTIPLRRQRAVVERTDAGSTSSDIPDPTTTEAKE